MNLYSITYTAQKSVPEGTLIESGSAIILATDNNAALGIAYSIGKTRLPASLGFYNHGAGFSLASPEEIEMVREFLK